MRNLHALDRFRVPYKGEIGDDTAGAFVLPSPVDHGALRVVAAADAGWDHVSVSREDRIPTWAEMELIKRLFFRDNETAMQLHVASAQHINIHPHCLHLWRPHRKPIPLPPRQFV